MNDSFELNNPSLAQQQSKFLFDQVLKTEYDNATNVLFYYRKSLFDYMKKNYKMKEERQATVQGDKDILLLFRWFLSIYEHTNADLVELIQFLNISKINKDHVNANADVVEPSEISESLPTDDDEKINYLRTHMNSDYDLVNWTQILGISQMEASNLKSHIQERGALFDKYARGGSKEYVKYNNRKYVVRMAKSGKYITCKGVETPLSSIRGKYNRL